MPSAGREESEEWRNGEVCNGACYYVFHNAGSVDTEGDNYVTNVALWLVADKDFDNCMRLVSSKQVPFLSCIILRVSNVSLLK